MSGGGGGGGKQESKEARELYKIQGGIAKEQWELFKSKGVSQIEGIEADIKRMTSPGGIAVEEGRAAANVMRSYDRERSGLTSALGRYGIRPGSGKFMSGLRQLALGRSADTAGARTNARVGVLDRGMRSRFGLLGALTGQSAQAHQGLNSAGGGLARIGANKANARSGFAQALGGLAGSLGSAWILASDRRLKRNIRPIGRLPNELVVYEFTYLDDMETVYTGLLADEVLDVLPEFVDHFGGYLTVDYRGVLESTMKEAA